MVRLISSQNASEHTAFGGSLWNIQLCVDRDRKGTAERGRTSSRWFNDEQLDLVVWHGEGRTITGFQLSYDKPHAEKAVSWRTGRGYVHNDVDDGERPGRYPGAAMLLADSAFEPDNVAQAFRSRATEIDQEVAQFVVNKLKQYRSSTDLRRWDCVVALGKTYFRIPWTWTLVLASLLLITGVLWLIFAG